MFCKILKLSNGETIVGNILEEAKGHVEVLFPVKVIYERKNDGVGIMFVKWDPTTNVKYPFRIFKSSIVSVSEPDDEFFEYYKKLYETFENMEEDERLEDVEFGEEKNEEFNEDLDKIMKLITDISNNKPTLH